MSNLKRTGWTTQEVILLLEGQKIYRADGVETLKCGIENQAIERMKAFFYDFLRPAEEFGAMAYEPKTDTVYHIGRIPYETKEAETVHRLERPPEGGTSDGDGQGDKADQDKYRGRGDDPGPARDGS